MPKTEEYIKRISRYLSDLKAISHEIENLRVELPHSSNSFANGRVAQRETTIQEMKVAESALKVAESYAPQSTWDGKLRPFSKEKLVVLQVKISPNDKTDPAVAELFNEASGQLHYLQKKLDEYDRETQRHNQALYSAGEELQSQARQKLDKLLARYGSIILSREYSTLLSDLENTRAASRAPHAHDLLIGSVGVPLPRPMQIPSFPDALKKVFSILEGIGSPSFNKQDGSIKVPLIIDINKGGALAMPRGREDTLDGPAIQRDLLLRSMAQSLQLGSLERVSYINPEMPSATLLGSLAPFTLGKNPIIRDLPLSRKEVRETFDDLENEIAEMERKAIRGGNGPGITRILVFESFPQAYNEQELQLIKKLSAMAASHHLLVIVGGQHNNDSAHLNAIGFDDLADAWVLPEGAMPTIKGLFLPQGSSFSWEKPVTDETPHLRVIHQSIDSRSTNDDNHYEARAPKALTKPVKGDRSLTNLPIGVNEDGNITCLSFENENFASYICGAAGSGKSTLLHSLLSSVFSTKHPDDVEIWLVDFKMVEFSRYTKEVPPHVRYIILDESPELVYDLIDRLNDILHKRLAIFEKNGWTSLNDAQQAGKYMPALLVVIDEFSTMSQIAEQSDQLGKDYKYKLEELFTKGRGLGFRLVLSSQNFTSGVRGLTKPAKDQIQQRIAMKAENDEIRNTLDIPRPSDADKRLMEELLPHYALLKVGRGTAQGSHVEKTHVLYFSDASEQKSYLAPKLARYVPTNRYEPSDFDTYVSKQPQIFDGNKLTDFSFVRPDALSFVARQKATAYDASSIYLLVGQPLRLKRLVPIELVSGFGENMLLQIPIAQGESFQSMLVTLAESLNAQGIRLNIVVGKTTPLLSRELEKSLPNAKIYHGEQGICSFFANENLPGAGSASFTVLLEIEPVLRGVNTSRRAQSDPWQVDIEKRAAGEPDCMTRLKMADPTIQADEQLDISPSNEERDGEFARIMSKLRNTESQRQDDSDTRTDILNLLEYGPTEGKHFLFVTQRASELKRGGVSLNWFRHRMAFRMAKSEAMEYVERYDARIIAKLPRNCFRYTNGIEGTTFRPYTHPGQGIFSDVDIDDIDETYLL